MRLRSQDFCVSFDLLFYASRPQSKYLSRKADLDSCNNLKDCEKGQQGNLVPVRLTPHTQRKQRVKWIAINNKICLVLQ